MNQKVSSVERVKMALADAGIEPRIEEFPASTRTAREAAAAIGTSVGQIVKSLLFMAGEAAVLALVSGSNQLDPERLEALLGAPLQKADAETVRAVTGYAIGGVPPIGFPRAIPTFIDRDLLQYEIIWAAGGTPRHVFPITSNDLVRITGGIIAELGAQPL